MNPPSRFETVMVRILAALSKPNALPEGWTATRDLRDFWQVSVRPLIVEGQNHHMKKHHEYEFKLAIEAKGDVSGGKRLATEKSMLDAINAAHTALKADQTLGGVAEHIHASHLQWCNDVLLLRASVYLKTANDDWTRLEKV